MSYDTVGLKKFDDGIHYWIASSCRPTGAVVETDPLAIVETFHHIDAVFVMNEDDETSIIFDVEKLCLREWMEYEGEEYPPTDLSDEDKTFYELWDIEKRLKDLFGDHWPTLEEIINALHR